jgi:hypothetical protein
MNFSKQTGFFAMLRSSEFLMYFFKQAGSGFEAGSESGSEIKVKVGSGSGKKNNFGSTTQQPAPVQSHLLTVGGVCMLIYQILVTMSLGRKERDQMSLKICH